MKIFIYKTLFIFFCLFLLFEFTIGRKINKFENEVKKIYSKENIKLIQNKIRDEISASLNKDRILSTDDAKQFKLFIDKIKSEINNN